MGVKSVPGTLKDRQSDRLGLAAAWDVSASLASSLTWGLLN